ncbi:MAG: hypothetical protein RLZZ52_445 [Actinomycetota bacterium]
MKALQFVSAGSYALNDVPVPTIGDDEVLLAARSVGICHSDIVLLEGRYILPFSFPVTPGHEWSAEVMEVGQAVSSLRPGDRVVGECVVTEKDHFGFTMNGAMSEYFVAKASWLHLIPENLSWTQGALVEPFSCGYNATLKADNLDAADTAIVFGAGPIGLGVVAAAAAKGVRVLIAEPSAARAQLARELGAEGVLDPSSEDFVEAALDATQGGAPVVFEASGHPSAMAATLEVAAFKARVVNIGIDVGRSAPAKLGLIQAKQLQIRGIIGSPGVWPETIRFLSRTGLDLSKLVTKTVPLAEATTAYDAVINDKTQVKVHVTSDAR